MRYNIRMNTYVNFIQDKIKIAPKKDLNGFNPVSYLGTTHTYLGITNELKENIAKEFKTQFPEIPFTDLIATITQLMNGDSFEEKTLGPFILHRYPAYRKQVKPTHLETWITNLQGWCEIDTLCQSAYDDKFFLAQWKTWKKALEQFSTHKNINHRRASLVLLCKPVRKSDDPRLYDLAIANVERLKQEKDILITKAISWVLREMTKQFKAEISEYLEKNQKTLPAIAVRETKKKLLTGKK